MTKQEKQLLLKDLCARLPYHVRVKVWLKDKTTEEGFFDFEHNYGDVLMDFFFYNKLKDLKPYLRPMSSMTDEECVEYNIIKCSICPDEPDDYAGFVDWLISHHFDYSGLIPMGLALEAPEGMYK